MVVDMDLIYGDAKLGMEALDLYLTAAVPRLTLKYDITLGDLPRVSHQPGLCDPVVGIGWHHAGSKVEWHATFDGGVRPAPTSILVPSSAWMKSR